MKFSVLALALVIASIDAFSGPVLLTRNTPSVINSSQQIGQSRLFRSQNVLKTSINDENEKSSSLFRRVLKRFDTTGSAGLEDAMTAGPGKFIKGLHGPKTYLALALALGLKYKWCFRNPYYWFGVAFCIKWYRARYVFKIPVWDRQPNWNNIITSKEQEKDLKAFTCTQCGSTLFIAKTREFFFEGDTGIGGLGCFSCGAKGAENFVQDRDRIVDDVGDMDDYFEYERPLDFVSRAERRKILKETGGDEDAANDLLMKRSGGESSAPNGDSEPETSEAKDESPEIVDAEIVEDEEPSVVEEAKAEEVAPAEAAASEETEAEPEKTKLKKSPKKKKKKSVKKVDSPPPSSPEDLDVLDMDSF